MGKLTLDMDSITVTSFETDGSKGEQPAATAATLATTLACCGGGCNTRLTCSTNLC